MMLYKLIVCLAIAVILSSCGPSSKEPGTKGSFIRLTQQFKKGAAENANNIKVFYQKKPNFAYIEVGIIEALAYQKVYSREVGLKDLFPELKKQAALVGAQAIHKIELKRHNQTGNTLHATAVAIVKK